ncbi:MAG TPA: hypothetical protein DEP18_01840 [Flavobacteriales bacterium]|nr:hypothetical protein [Flavobacteriales bacterium]HRE97745.1 hypothetical protein [Flavobacteriales bacterium]HRJ35914.1 hypothetical protein [Flavobacteriales bacterium]HRJ39375.1 hypothetical protein [Flavobacteriales bacterium]
MEGLIIHTVAINRQGELKHFEIPLSNNAKFITGLWYKVRLITDAESGVVTELKSRSPYQPEVIIGELSLSSNQREGVFYFGKIILDNANYGLLDYTGGVFRVNNYSHAKFPQSLKVKVDADTAIVHGYIHDNWGVISGRNVRYEIDLYIYQQLKEKP